MAENFDSYYTWLGIPPEDQPPDHYALLGVRQFESNHDVISNLTDQRMAHVKTFQGGPHGALSQKLLNEIAAARVCLLNPERRKPYDAKMREQIALRTAPEAVPLAKPEIIVPPPVAPPAATPQSDSVSDAFAFIAATTARPAAAGSNLAVRKAVQSRAKQRARARWLFIAAPILGIAAVVAAIMIRNSQDADDGDSAETPKIAVPAVTLADQKTRSKHDSLSPDKISAAKSQGTNTVSDTGVQPSESDRPAAEEPAAEKQSSLSPQSEESSAANATAPAAREAVFLDDLVGQEVIVSNGGLGKHGSTGYPESDPDWQVRHGGQAVKHALSMHPLGYSSSRVSYVLNGKYDSFAALAAIMDGRNPSASSLQFRVFGDSKLLWSSSTNLQQPGDHEACNVAIHGVDLLRLEVICSGDNRWAHAAWIDPSVSRQPLRPGSGERPAARDESAAASAASAHSGSNSPALHSEQPTRSESWTARAKALIQSGGSAKTPGDRAELMRSSLRLFSQAEGAERWNSQASELVALAESVGRQTNEGELIASLLRTAEKRIRRERTMAEGATAAQEGLAKNPDDPGANTIVGRFLCLQMDDWAEGLPHLVKGSDFSLTKLANSEQSPPSDPAGQFKLANSWWDVANKRIGLKPNPWLEPMEARAAYWYRKCASGLAGSELTTAQKRIAETEAVASELAALADGQAPLPLGQWIDVLGLIDTNSKMVVAGDWSRDGRGISVEPSKNSPRVTIPVVVNGSYDLEIDFARTSGSNCVCAMLPIGSGSCMLFLSGFNGAGSGFSGLSGNWWPGARPGTLENGHLYKVLINARFDSPDHGTIDVALDGKPYFPRWSGNPATLGMFPQWPMPNPKELGLGADAVVTFHSAHLKMLSGTASLDPALISASH